MATNIAIKTDRDFELSLEYLRMKYGEGFEYLNGLHDSNLNFSDFIEGFVDKNVADITIDPNANASHKDVRALIAEKGKGEDKLTSANKIFHDMKKIYGLETARTWWETEWNGGFYMHDFPSASKLNYCYAYDLTRLATEGLFFLDNYNNQPPAHLTTYIDDLIEYISFFCNRSSGAVGLPNVIIWAYYFWQKDVKDDYVLRNPDYYLRQSFQKLIFRLNQPFLRIDQSAFTNVSIFDRYYIKSLFGGVVFPDGTCVIDHVDDIIECEKVFMEVVSATRSINLFTFPVLTYSLLKKKISTPEFIANEQLKPGFDINEWMTERDIAEMRKTKNYNVFVDNEFARWCSDHNTTWNDANFFMSTDVSSLSNCCRLVSDTSKLTAFINSIGGTALSIGSIKVNTINLMRIVYEVDEWIYNHINENTPAGEVNEMRKSKYLELLEKRVLLCCKTLDVQRHIIKRNIDKGLLPNFCDGGVEMDKCYSTIGILGMYEVIEAMEMTTLDEFGNRYYTDEGIEFASQMFNVINKVKDEFNSIKHQWIKVDTNNLQYADLNVNYSFNCESVPAERAAVILCQKDNALYETDVLTGSKSDKFIYSNQWIPLSEKCTLKEKLRVCSILDQKCSGGAIAHINLESNFPNTEAAWINLNEIALSDVIYFAYNTRINECKNHHGFLSKICDVCGEPVFDTYQRIVGYLVPTRAYSKDRKREFDSRLWFDYAQTLME